MIMEREQSSVIADGASDRRDQPVEIQAALGVLFRGKRLVLAIIVIFTIASVAAAFLTKPVYRATVILVPADVSGTGSGLQPLMGQFGGLASLAGIDLKPDDRTAEAMALLESRQFTESFLRDGDLLLVLFASRWDVEEKRWRDGLRKIPTLNDGVRFFDRKVRRVHQDTKTGLVTLEIDWTNPNLAATWANELVRRANFTLRQRDMAETDKMVEYLNQELEKTNVAELRQAIYRLIEAQIKQKTLAKVRDEYVFRVLDPAAPPDSDDFVRPKRALYVVSGPVFGFIIAVFFVLTWNFAATSWRTLRSTR